MDAAQIEIARNYPVLDLVDRGALRGRTELAGPCPKCGGTDRFHVNARKNAWFCRTCTGERWHNAIDYLMLIGYSFVDAVKHLTNGYTPENIGKIAADLAKARQHEEEKLAEEERATINRQRQKLWAEKPQFWMKAWREMGVDGRNAWVARGLDEDWINYYQVGYTWTKLFNGRNPWSGYVLTIPYLRLTKVGPRPIQISLRLTGNYDEVAGKYRPYMTGLGKQLYVARYREPLITGTILLVEGEIKAMVANAWMVGLFNNVVGISGKYLKPAHVLALASAEKIYICLDPDANDEAEALAWKLGPERCHLLDLPDKIDDMILRKSLTRSNISALLNTARRV